MSEIRSRILGLGMYVPARVVTNDDLSKMMETTHEWIVERTGIEERRWVDETEGPSELGTQAAKRAIENAGLAVRDIDMIICATLSPDYDFPGTGVLIQRQLGLREIPALDIRQQCSGFIYGVSIADKFIRTGAAKHVLVIGTEVHSTGLDISTKGRDVAVLFGDGAGAAVIGRATGDDSVILSTHIHADGTDAEILFTEKPGSRFHPRITVADLEEGRHFPKMQGKQVFKHAVTRMIETMMEGMVANQLELDDVAMVIPHQANLRINQYVAQKIGLPDDKMHNNIQKYGNTTAATIPMCMYEAVELGKIKRGDVVCLVAFGAGLTWGSVFLRY